MLITLQSPGGCGSISVNSEPNKGTTFTVKLKNVASLVINALMYKISQIRVLSLGPLADFFLFGHKKINSFQMS